LTVLEVINVELLLNNAVGRARGVRRQEDQCAGEGLTNLDAGFSPRGASERREAARHGH